MKTKPITEKSMGYFRRIYPSAKTGKRINSVSELAELLFWHLQMVCDDYGLFNADPFVLSKMAYPRRDVSSARVESEMAELEEVGLIRTYEAEGEKLAAIVDFVRIQPAGRNGKRILQHTMPSWMDEDGNDKIGDLDAQPVNPDDSGGIQIIPSESQRVQGNPVTPAKAKAKAKAKAQAEAQQQQQPTHTQEPPAADSGFAAAAFEVEEEKRKAAALAEMIDLNPPIARHTAEALAEYPWVTADAVKRRRRELRSGEKIGLLITRLKEDERAVWEKDQRMTKADEELLATITPKELKEAVQAMTTKQQQYIKTCEIDGQLLPIRPSARRFIANRVRLNRSFVPAQPSSIFTSGPMRRDEGKIRPKTPMTTQQALAALSAAQRGVVVGVA